MTERCSELSAGEFLNCRMRRTLIVRIAGSVCRGDIESLGGGQQSILVRVLIDEAVVLLCGHGLGGIRSHDGSDGTPRLGRLRVF